MPPSLPLPLSDSASPGCVCAGTFPMWLKGGEAQRTEGLGWRGGGEGLAFRRVCLKDRALLGFPEMRQRRGVKANGLAPLCRQSWVWTLARVANGCGSYLSASESRGEREGERGKRQREWMARRGRDGKRCSALGRWSVPTSQAKREACQ